MHAVNQGLASNFSQVNCLYIHSHMMWKQTETLEGPILKVKADPQDIRGKFGYDQSWFQEELHILSTGQTEGTEDSTCAHKKKKNMDKT